MDPKEGAKLLRWWHELECEEESSRNKNEVQKDDAGQTNHNLEGDEDDPFLPSESEYVPSSESETESEAETEFHIADHDSDAGGENGNNNQPTIISWNDVDGSSLKQFAFTDESRINVPSNLRPVDIFRLFVDEDILDSIVLETNKNASRYKSNWIDISAQEMEKMFAILLYMGLAPLPKISDYWSRKFLCRHCFVRHIMSRNRFQAILRFIHFADNETTNKKDRLYKIRPLTDASTKKFKELKVPSEVVSIDESMVPFRGRLLFRQYIPGKASKYGVKIFKLCDESGYTYETEIYKGKSDTITAGRSSNTVVLNLMKDYLGNGRTLVADNYYNNLELSDLLLERNTHSVGTLRKYVKGVPREILDEKKMKKGDIKGKECNGKVIGNWKDKRSVRFISTRHTLNIIDTNKQNRKGETIYKPEAIVFYNKFKMGIDLSDQLASYFTVLRRSIRWYHKVAFEYLFGTSVINAPILYQLSNKNKNQVAEFREALVMGLLGDVIDNENRSKKTKHVLKESVDKTKDNRKKRRRCIGCYDKEYKIHKKSKIAAQKTKLVSTSCSECPNSPALCLECFQIRN